MPPATIAWKGVSHPVSRAKIAIKAAPPREAAEPAAEIPPEVPAGTCFPDTIERGTPPRRVPTSVPHVSAVDAASAPTAIAARSADGDKTAATAAAANTPPF